MLPRKLGILMALYCLSLAACGVSVKNQTLKNNPFNMPVDSVCTQNRGYDRLGLNGYFDSELSKNGISVTNDRSRCAYIVAYQYQTAWDIVDYISHIDIRLMDNRNGEDLVLTELFHNSLHSFGTKGFITKAVKGFSTELAKKRQVENTAYAAQKHPIPTTVTRATSEPPALRFSFTPAKKQNKNAVAVIVGNRNYAENGQNIPDVRFAHNDADRVKEFLIAALGYRDGNIIDLRDATQASLVSVFGNETDFKGQLYNWVRPGVSDVFVFYSGHGAPSLNSGRGYLLPVDANPNTIELNGYSLETLYANLGKIPAKSLTVVIDACFSGSSQAGSVITNASAISLRRVETKSLMPKATVITASSISEVASWDEEAHLGLFTRHFLEGMAGKADAEFGNSDGVVSLNELKGYLGSEVTYMARRLFMREQHPQISGDLAHKLN